jgi:hypothetical protein
LNEAETQTHLALGSPSHFFTTNVPLRGLQSLLGLLSSSVSSLENLQIISEALDLVSKLRHFCLQILIVDLELHYSTVVHLLAG